MIDRRIEYILEQLHPHLLGEQLALSQLTAAAVHHLTARDITHHIDLLATTPRSRPATDHLADLLALELDQIRPLLVDASSGADRPVQTGVDDDHILVTVPTASRPITLEIITLDPDLQPVVTCPKPVRPGGLRFPTVDATTLARQLTVRWLTDPNDTHNCLGVALAADRVGAPALWTERMAAATAPLVPDLHATVQDAAARIDSPSIPRRLARQAQRGLDELERHLGQHRTAGRCR